MRIALTLLISLCVSCSTTNKDSEPSKSTLPNANAATPAAEKELLAAQTELKKNPLMALKKLEALVQKYPDSVISSTAAKNAGDYYFNSKKGQQALNAYSYILNNKTYEPFEYEVISKSLKILNDSGQKNEARSLLQRSLQISNISPEQRADLLRARYELDRSVMSPYEQLLLLSDLYKYSSTNASKTSYLLRANSTADSLNNPEDIEKVLNDSRLAFVHANLHFRLGVVSFEKSNYSQSRYHFNRVISLNNESELSESAKDYLEQLDARSSVDSKTIGVILPLTGKYADIGKSVLNSIQLGLGIFDKKSDLRLAVVDSEGKFLDARRAVEKLVIEDKVIGIIGSLQSKTATIISSKAQALGVPTIVLSQKSGITQIGDYVFRNALTSEMQVDSVVKSAIENRGLKKFAILYPDDAYGNEYANLFWEAVQKYGGQIRASQSYDPSETDFRVSIQKLVGTFYTEDRQYEYRQKLEEWKKKFPTKSARNEIPDDLLVPIVDFDALFIPDSTRALGQVAAMLTFQDIKNVTLLGTNIWNTPSIVERAGAFSSNLLFVDSVLTSDEQFLKSEFVQKFQATFKKYPSLFDLQAYDTAVILKKALSNASSRSDLQQEFAKMSSGESRDFVRPIVSLTVKDGKIVRAQ